eukprot:SAG22_NODE_274_length_13178_cov_17.793715_6_plen_676_part_00
MGSSSFFTALFLLKVAVLGTFFAGRASAQMPAVSGITGPLIGEMVSTDPTRMANIAPATGLCWDGAVSSEDETTEAACTGAGKAWKACYSAGTLSNDAFMFCDRGYPYLNVPDFLDGRPYILTANSDKASDRSDTDFLCFDIDIDSTVYVLYDNRALELPAWLSATYTNQHTAVAHVEDGMGHYNIYFAEVPAGQVCFGGNFEVAAGEAAAYASCYSDAWTVNCDDIGDPPGEGSMYTVVVGEAGGRPIHEINSDAQPTISGVVAAADRPAAAAAGVCWNGEVKAEPQPADEAACTSADASYVWIDCYSVSTFAADSLYMCDRNYVFEGGPLPSYLAGIQQIRTANSDKASDRSDTDFLCFDIDVPGTVYVLYDSRALELPDWLSAGFDNQHATIANVTDGVDAYNVYFAGFPAGQVCLGGNFEFAAGEAAAYASCYSDEWTVNCDDIGDPPGEGSMYVPAVGPLLTHAMINLDGTSFAREVIPDVTQGDGTVTAAGALSCAGTVAGATSASDVSNLGRPETAEKVYSFSVTAGQTVTFSSCGSQDTFDTTLSVYRLTDGTPSATTTEVAAITLGGAAKTATRISYHDGTGSTCGHLAEINDLAMAVGEYLVVIDGWKNGNPDHRHGSFQLSATCVPDVAVGTPGGEPAPVRSGAAIAAAGAGALLALSAQALLA